MKANFSSPTKTQLTRSAFYLLLLSVGALLALLHPEVMGKDSERTLTFQERVAYQRAIEEVYWRHRTWPRERPDPKPSLDAVVSQAQLEKKVADYLRNSQALEDCGRQPITAQQLQAEMDRMAQHTKQPKVLRELFEALDNDPFIIAECLARPILAERLKPSTVESRKVSLDSWAAGAQKPMPKVAAVANTSYRLPRLSNDPTGCVDDTWTATNTTNAPNGREGHTAVWTGNQMIVWGGIGGIILWDTGGRYDPASDSWTNTSTTNAPSGRYLHTAVWTGTEMIVWGGAGCPVGCASNTGGRYNPTTDSWAATSITNAPSARFEHRTVWTGSEMIVWGGRNGFNYYNTGGRYNPNTDTWTATSVTGAPAARSSHSGVWSGNEMIVWSGYDGFNFLNTGGRYNPSANSWTATSTTNVPAARFNHTAVWTGSEMIVWGGANGIGSYLNTGGRYNPIANNWAATSTANAPSVREFHTAIWTDTEMIVWGGVPNDSISGETYGAPFTPPTPTSTPTSTPTGTPTPTPPGTGGRYNPGTDTWTTTSTTDAPFARYDHTAIWSGSQMIVWGGFGDSGYLNTGGKYCAQPAFTPTPTPTASPTTSSTPTCAGCSVTSPNCGTTAFSPPTDFIVHLNPPGPAALQESDFTVNGIPADSFMIVSGGATVHFYFNTSPAVPGENTIHIADCAFFCGPGSVPEFTCTFLYKPSTPTPTPTATLAPRVTPTHRPHPTPAPRP